MANEKKGFSFDDIEDAVLPSTVSSIAAASATDTLSESSEDEAGDESDDNNNGDDGDEDLRETGVHENEVDALLIDTGTPGGEIEDLNETEKFTLQVKAAFDKTVGLGEELLRDSTLSLRERAAAIEVVISDLDMQLDKDAIKADNELVIAGRATKASLQRTLEYTLQRLCLEAANATPSTLPERIQGVSDTDLERMALGLGELELKAVTEEGKKEALRLHAIVAADKARRTATGPTIAVSLTPPPPPPPVEERQPLIVPPASAAPVIETVWQSGPESVRPADEAVTHDAPLKTVAPAAVSPASPAPSEEPSVHVSISMEKEMNQHPQQQPPAETEVPPVLEPPAPSNSEPVEVRTRMRVGRALNNDWVIEQPHISAHHAVLTINEGSLQIEDLGSTHGTFVLDELANWVRITQGSPAVVKIGQRFRFANIEAVSSHDKSKRTNVHFVKPDGKISHSIGFFWAGEQQSELHRLEQARLNAEDAARQPKQTPLKTPDELDKKSPTQMQQAIAKSNSTGNGLSRALGVGVLILGALALLAVLFMWGSGGFNRHHTVATTETETSTESETETVSETETTAETETSTPTDTVTTETGYSRRPGRDVASCEHVTSFLLARADGEAYWDCSGITPDQYRDLYRIEDPMGARHVIANTCACQRCEPTVH
ncbi:FHA domain-containing protein [Candidatus Uhrbacteria bacterium]|nr:MAG: FHA domain-containing protein [Candidatus Uhrbacteria bacterium]